MSPPTPSASALLDTYFLEARSKLLDLAAFLDRLDRAPDAATLKSDPRLLFLADALTILQSQTPNRTEQLQRRYSL
ncbi:MAG: hypothetical protein ACTHN5_16000 [Phycisphaerae bacterium]